VDRIYLEERTMKNLVIVGSGGLAEEILWIVNDINTASDYKKWNILGFWDDRTQSLMDFCGYPIRKKLAELLPKSSHKTYFSCGIGDNKTRRKVCQEIEGTTDLMPATLIHPTAIIAENAVLGVGSIVEPYVVIAPGSKVGKHGLLNTGATVGHHSVSGDYINFCPGVRLGGKTRVGDLTFVGSNAVIQPGVSLGIQVTVGAGAFVLRRVLDDKTVIGNPAKSI
jgi:sugar O-acyltransferase (sialic acid O-acetyltransferase NeuD family)